ncbi:bifunctional riboflavin kinase/FAD synthetase [Cupriavidus oxalaticus]|uniref:bifunctional riboflavin kinase/FAD synthetase n=1 Tax=Cupriavidus oxalaticus TaxID=96344 RepID=UPI003176EDA5
MEIICGLPSSSKRLDCALSIGNFDGVHRGHQALLAQLVCDAHRRGLPSTVMTFDPHPRTWLALRRGHPEQAPTRIGTLRDKATELRHWGVDRLVVMRFDESFSRLPAQSFIDDVLCNAMKARYMLLGDDFRFGAGREGDTTMLQQAGKLRGFDVASMASHEVLGLRVSSTCIRDELERGNLANTCTLLGRPYEISGRIVRGSGHGSNLGFPSINLRIGTGAPAARGTFVVRIKGAGSTVHAGMGSIGMQQTADGRLQPMLRVHVWDRLIGPEHRDLGLHVRVEFLHRLHDGQSLGNPECSPDCVARDVIAARHWWRCNHRLLERARSAPADARVLRQAGSHQVNASVLRAGLLKTTDSLHGDSGGTHYP